jgi:hypothetical protein
VESFRVSWAANADAARIWFGPAVRAGSGRQRHLRGGAFAAGRCLRRRTSGLKGVCRESIISLQIARTRIYAPTGYAVCDAAIRKRVEVGVDAPTRFPYPEASLV